MDYIATVPSFEDASRVGFAQLALLGRFTVPIMPRDVDLKARISYAIRAARTDRRLSRRELAEAVGVGPSAVGDWENGVSVPSLLHLGALADALGVSADLFAHPPAVPESAVARWRLKAVAEEDVNYEVSGADTTKAPRHEAGARER